MSIEDEYVKSITDCLNGMREHLGRVPGTIDGICDTLRVLIPWDQDWVERQRADCHTEFAKLRTEADKFGSICPEECARVVTVKSMREAANAFEQISFAELLNGVDMTNLLGKRDDWVSPNQQLYEAKVQPLHPRVQTLKDNLTTLIEGLRKCDSVQQAYTTGGLNAVGGLALGLAGLAFALATSWTGIGAIIGLGIAIVSFAYSLFQFFLLPDISAEIKAAADRVTKAATTHDGMTWPSKPNLPAQAW